MSSRQKAKIAFSLALLLLCLSGLAAGFAIIRLYQVETLVRHTYDVEVAIGDLESSLTEVGRTRVAFVNSATPQNLQYFLDAVNKVGPGLARVRQLTVDNPEQQKLCDRLDATSTQRVAISRSSVERKQQNLSDPASEQQSGVDVARSAFETAAVTAQMRGVEDALLRQRSHLSELLFTAIPGILCLSFLASGCMFWLHYHLLNRELQERKSAENQLRHLSLQLMRAQDEERRRFARELHDGLGQTLAGAKMMVDALATRYSRDDHVEELATLLGDALSQTRTVSHLFYPPFLEEIGFASAARWLIEGYEKRMGVTVVADIPRPEYRLPANLELTLYRVLQESLNNIQRHSKSSKAEVIVRTEPDSVTMRVKDFGRGIPDETLAAFSNDAHHAGVGLTGMKERVREQGGEIEIHSERTGTEIIVKIPISAQVEPSQPVS